MLREKPEEGLGAIRIRRRWGRFGGVHAVPLNKSQPVRIGQGKLRLPERAHSPRLRRWIPFPRSSAALAAVLVLAGCATTPEPKAVATPHLGQEVTFMAADTDQSGNLTAEEVVLHHHQEMLAGYDQDRDQRSPRPSGRRGIPVRRRPIRVSWPRTRTRTRS